MARVRAAAACVSKKYINGTKGVISLFLAILMVPFVTIIGALINAGRINSAVAIYDEALCNASNSTLGTYDSFLRSRFGLMAISQDTSSGGSQFGHTEKGYTSEKFVNDLFTYYMEKNVGALSNTYSEVNVSAEGLYPLGDYAVLNASVLQASKFTVPAKLAADWGSLDAILNSITKPLNTFASIENVLSGSVNIATEIGDLVEKQDALEKKLESCETAISEYQTAYNQFIDAYNAFNTLITNIANQETTVAGCKSKVESIEASNAALAEEISTLQEQIDKWKEEEEGETTHAQEIEEAEKQLKEKQEEMEKAAPGYEEAKQNLSNAEAQLQAYKDQFAGKRTAVISAKETYYQKILALRDALEAAGNAAVAFQSAINKLVNEGIGLISSATTAGLNLAKDSIDKQKEQLDEQDEYYRYQQTLAGYEDNTQYESYYYNLQQENESTRRRLDEEKRKYSNGDKVTSELINASKAANSEMTAFANRDLTREFGELYGKLTTLAADVYGIAVPDTYQGITLPEGYDPPCYCAIESPVKKEDVASIVGSVVSQIANNAGWKALQAMVNFLKAMLDIGWFSNPQLDVKLNPGAFQGGLPSERGDDHITYEHAAEDAEQSEKYKELLNSYSDVQVYDLAGDSESTADVLINCVHELIDLMGKPLNLLTIIAVIKTVKTIFTAVKNFFQNLGKAALLSMRDKLLLVGYVSYNTANRTTYAGGKALSGASFSLPRAEESGGLAFAGAETEYIFGGSMDESWNQRKVFLFLWLERLVFNIAPVCKDPTIQTIAAAVAAVTFGAGDIIVKCIAIVIESFVDAILLSNGGQIPIYKSYPYITPPGVLKLLEQVVHFQFDDKKKESLYEGARNLAYNTNEEIKETALEHGKYIGEDVVELPTYQDASASLASDGKKFSNKFTIDYTKSMQILLLVGVSTKKIVRRLADVIQMEAGYYYRREQATFEFDIDKSFTYIRASGNFASNFFIQIGDGNSVTSKERVIYNGY